MSDPRSLLDLPCLSPWLAVQVLASSRVSACCSCPIKYATPCPGGDLIADMNSPAAQGLREKMRTGGRCPTCQRFGIRQFNPGMALNKTYLEATTFDKLRRGRGPSSKFLSALDVRFRELDEGTTTITLPPLRVNLNIDMKCNLSCIMCRQRALPPMAPTPNSYLDFIITNHDRIGCVALVGGEPFASNLTMGFMDRIATKQCDFTVSIITNGLLLDFDLIQRLNISHAMFSCDAATPETYAAIRRGGDFNTFIQNITRYRDLRRAGRIGGTLVVNYTVMTKNLREIPAAVQKFNDLDIAMVFTNCVGSASMTDPEIDNLSGDERQEAIVHLSSAIEIAKQPAREALCDIRKFLRDTPESKSAPTDKAPTRYRGFVGPKEYYDLKGAQQFNLLTLLGLREHHTLLDIGCGSLRAVRLFIPYLNPGNYFGIELYQWLVAEGQKYEVGDDLIRIKSPDIRINGVFDFSVFGRKTFDWLLAHAIFIHASLADIRKCLAEARKIMHESSIFFFDFNRAEKNADA